MVSIYFALNYKALFHKILFLTAIHPHGIWSSDCYYTKMKVSYHHYSNTFIIGLPKMSDIQPAFMNVIPLYSCGLLC